MTPDPETGPRSLRRVLQIMSLVAGEPDGLSLTELSGPLNAPKSSLHSLLKALVTDGYLVSEGKRYALGAASHKLALVILTRFDLPAVARPYMRELAEQVNETIVLATLSPTRDRAVYVDKADARSAIRFIVTAGDSRPLYCTAAGKVLLAHQDNAWLDAYFESTELRALTTHTLCDAKQLRRQLGEVRRLGIAASVEEATVGVAGFASPVVDGGGQVVAALTLGGPVDRVVDRWDELGPAVQTTARKISHALGLRGDYPGTGQSPPRPEPQRLPAGARKPRRR